MTSARPDLRETLLESPRERRAWDIGASRAVAAMDRAGTSDPRSLAAAMELPVEESRWNATAGLVILGRYTGDVIEVYPDQIRDAASENGVPFDHLIAGVVAHEVGHAAVPTEALRGPRDRRLLARLATWIGLAHEPKRVTEAAANGFAFQVLDQELDESPLFASPTVLTDPSRR